MIQEENALAQEKAKNRERLLQVLLSPAQPKKGSYTFGITHLISWLEVYYERKGKLTEPVYERDGFDEECNPKYKEVKGITWSTIDDRLKYANIEGTNAKSLSEFKKEHGFGAEIDKAKLIELIETYYEKEGKYPHATSGAVYERDGFDEKGHAKYKEVKGVNWATINSRIAYGKIEGVDENSLSEFIKACFVDKIDKAKLIELIETYYEKEGKYPNVHSGVVYEKDGVDESGKPKYKVVKGVNWTTINARLANGNIEGTTAKSLSEFKKEHGLVKEVDIEPKPEKAQPQAGGAGAERKRQLEQLRKILKS